MKKMTKNVREESTKKEKKMKGQIMHLIKVEWQRSLQIVNSINTNIIV